MRTMQRGRSNTSNGSFTFPEIVEPYQIPDTNNIMPIDEKSTFNIRLDEDQIELLAKHIALQIFDYLKSDDEVKSEKPWQPKEKTPFGYG